MNKKMKSIIRHLVFYYIDPAKGSVDLTGSIYNTVSVCAQAIQEHAPWTKLCMTSTNRSKDTVWTSALRLGMKKYMVSVKEPFPAKEVARTLTL